MQKDSRLFDDFTKLASSAAGTMADLKREIEMMVMDKVEKILYRMDLVKREEFEVVRQMAEKARKEQEHLSTRLAILEESLRKNLDSSE